MISGSLNWADLVFYLAPLVMIGGGFYLMIKNMFERDYKIKLLEAKLNMQKDVIPLRLQAYERITLFLERISPNNLLYSNMSGEMTIRSFQSRLLDVIRSEFEHNITQQVYISPQTWGVIRAAKEDVIKLINTSANELQGDRPAIELSKKIFEQMMKDEESPVQKALNYIKSEVSQLF
jgi:hypothetical protein